MDNEKDLEVKDTDTAGQVKDEPVTKDGGEVDRDKLAEELRKEFEKEADRRVTEAIKKVTKKLKAEQEESERKAKLTQEELLKEEALKREQEQAEKERALNIKEMKLALVDVLTENGMDLGFRELVDVSSLLSVEEDKRLDVLKEKVQAVKTIFDAEVEKRVETVKKDFLTGGTPTKINNKDTKTPISSYEKAKKQGDVKSMLSAKIQGAVAE